MNDEPSRVEAGSLDAHSIQSDLSRVRLYSDLADMGVIADDEAARRIRAVVFGELDMLDGRNPMAGDE